MDETSKNDTATRKNDFTLAKILFRKYGVLHSFHEEQLKAYPIACCNISIDGQTEIYPLDKSVTYAIVTERYYKKTGKKTVKRRKFSLCGIYKVPKGRYEKETQLAVINLIKWSKELLWEDATKVKVIIDGKEVTRDSTDSGGGKSGAGGE